MCFDNTYSHSTKLVSIYILSFHSDALMKKFENDKELNETAHMAKVSRKLKRFKLKRDLNCV